MKYKVLINVPVTEYIGDIEASNVTQAREKAEVKFVDRLDKHDEISLMVIPENFQYNLIRIIKGAIQTAEDEHVTDAWWYAEARAVIDVYPYNV